MPHKYTYSQNLQKNISISILFFQKKYYFCARLTNWRELYFLNKNFKTKHNAEER